MGLTLNVDQILGFECFLHFLKKLEPCDHETWLSCISGILSCLHKLRAPGHISGLFDAK